MSHLNFSIFGILHQFLAFYINFCPKKSDLSGNTAWPQASGFQKLAKLTIFGIFNEAQNAYEARFARNVEWYFFVIFKHRGLQFINYGWEGVQEVIMLFKMCSTGCEKKNGRKVFLDEKLAFALISLR